MSDSVIRPLGDMVLVKPAPRRTETESGLAIVEHYQPDTVGTVVALGTGVEARKRAVQAFADSLIEAVCMDMDAGPADYERVAKLIASLRDDYRPEHVCKVGDEVLFGTGSGTELDIAGDTYILINEADLEAVLEPV